MPVINNTGFILATGTLAQAAINASTAWTSLPIQSDQLPVPWAEPIYDGTTLPRPARLRKALNGNVVGVGLYQFQWKFDYWTHGMMDYFLDTFLTTSSVRVWAKACSVKTYDEIDAAVYLNCVVNYPTGDRADYGWSEVVVRFDSGVLV